MFQWSRSRTSIFQLYCASGDLSLTVCRQLVCRQLVCRQFAGDQNTAARAQKAKVNGSVPVATDWHIVKCKDVRGANVNIYLFRYRLSGRFSRRHSTRRHYQIRNKR